MTFELYIDRLHRSLRPSKAGPSRCVRDLIFPPGRWTRNFFSPLPSLDTRYLSATFERYRDVGDAPWVEPYRSIYCQVPLEVGSCPSSR